MRIPAIIFKTLVILQLRSQTVTQPINFDPPIETVGIYTLSICHEMKPDCQPGRLVKYDRSKNTDTSVTYIFGHFIDINQKKIPNAFFQVINQQTGFPYQSIADSSGHFGLIGIEPGTYLFKAHFFGYKEFIVKDLKLTPGEMTHIIIDLGEYCCTKKEIILKKD